MKKPVITILLPTYNRRQYLPAALKCLKEQTFRDFACLVINDGGDDVADIVSAMKDDRFQYCRRPHLGKPAALNFGLSTVQSKYIAYMDDDDEIYPMHLQLLFEAAEKNQKDFVFSDTEITTLSADGEILCRRIENELDVTPAMLRFHNYINHKQILHTKVLADKTGLYDEKLAILIDFDYIRRMAFLSPPFHVKKVTGNHILRPCCRVNPQGNSITALRDLDKAAAGQSILQLFSKTPEDLSELYYEYIQISNEWNQLRRSISFRAYRVIVWPLRAVQDVVRCWREIGFFCTLKKILSKFRNLFRNGKENMD